jgi:hypothetical protein
MAQLNLELDEFYDQHKSTWENQSEFLKKIEKWRGTLSSKIESLELTEV